MTIPEVISKIVDMQNNSMTLPHVSHAPGQTWGGKDILHFWYFLDTMTPRPNYKSLSEGWGPGCTGYNMTNSES